MSHAFTNADVDPAACVPETITGDAAWYKAALEMMRGGPIPGHLCQFECDIDAQPAYFEDGIALHHAHVAIRGHTQDPFIWSTVPHVVLVVQNKASGFVMGILTETVRTSLLAFSARATEAEFRANRQSEWMDSHVAVYKFGRRIVPFPPERFMTDQSMFAANMRLPVPKNDMLMMDTIAHELVSSFTRPAENLATDQIFGIYPNFLLHDAADVECLGGPAVCPELELTTLTMLVPRAAFLEHVARCIPSDIWRGLLRALVS